MLGLIYVTLCFVQKTISEAFFMKIGIITGGGDAPGLNGIIESVGRTILARGGQVLGIRNGFEGIFEKRTGDITEKKLHGLHAQAGTFLGASNKSAIDGREAEFVKSYKELGLDGLIVAGGDGTFRGISRVREDVKVIGVPKTIDNDLSGTDVCFGFDTACTVVADALEALWHTAEAHDRIFFVEAMGRTAGWIALGGGLAAYADAILIPEIPIDQVALLQFVKEKRKRQKALMIVVAEGAAPLGGEATVAFRVEGHTENVRLGGVSQVLARWLEAETGFEARHVVLGHLQRSHAPTTADRLLTLEMGVRAATLALEKQWNRAVVYRNGKLDDCPIEDVMGPARTVPPDHHWVRKARSLGIFI